MSEDYRLVFTGEVSEGQHPAVVRKRLAALLKLDDARMDVLFSGKTVVVKKVTDEKTAVRYQQAFQKAGARLRVLPVEAAAEAAGDASQAAGDASHPSDEQEPASDGLRVLPVGSNILEENERVSMPPRDVDTGHLSVQAQDEQIQPHNEPDVALPEISHISLAAPGADLADIGEVVIVDEIDVAFDLAEVGAIIGAVDSELAAEFDFERLNFELAEPGADLDTATRPQPPLAPDTSHISLDEDARPEP